ncbi:sugar O-acetyltransferase [uncultured Alistipes sp.]|jgi:maltose O-acetyltransferase|uniref:sugar O-acetyltransferase n=1 Tax=Alistipes sp. TaxID=1872444 RepID=UPI0025D198A0|nr:sugar O-acetyltransferase [uncultured Alistipes sp.]
MTELEKMRSALPYDFSSPELQRSFAAGHRNAERFNRTDADDPAGRAEALAALIPGIPASACIMPPFFCDHGHGIRLGEEVFVNANCTFLDSGTITIGARTKIGPNCQLYTPQHPLDYAERRAPVETGHPITIGEDCWLGGGVIVCPGVTIGDRCIIGAGSVVTRDIPADSLAAGNPAKVKRKIR